ncbi:MAG TPA: 6-phosphogluconolactonase, partial [Candidatus Dormibacteraeota bacterium]|nr:6-phosphogluconolactonase [Candidatus Dormibacteraeota bacterium]
MTVFEDGPAVAMAAADRIAAALSLGARTLVLAGGTTFGVCYQILAQRPIEWGRVTVLFGDERCVPPDHPDSNYLMARERLLDRVMPATIYRIPAELGADLAAAEYDAVVAHLRPLDLVLLGMGPDGHTASLFPGNNALHADGWAVGVHGSPKPPADRVS